MVELDDFVQIPLHVTSYPWSSILVLESHGVCWLFVVTLHLID